MRKIIILFVCSVVLFFSGIAVFASELSQFKTKKQSLKGKEITVEKKIDEDITKVSLPDYWEVDGNHALQIDAQEDESLDANTIKITYSNVMQLESDVEDDDDQEKSLEMGFYLDTDLEDSNKSWQDWLEYGMNIWKSKTIPTYQLTEDQKKVEIRYGSNLKDKIVYED